MLIIVDPNSGVPVYRQLMDQIKFHIAGGMLKPGNPLPSTRALSSQLGVNPMTISKAYSYLLLENVVERRPGRPLVVKAFGEDEGVKKKLNQLRESLANPVKVVKQLGIKPETALETFQSMLEKTSEEKGATS